jgi:hypothetical protein
MYRKDDAEKRTTSELWARISLRVLCRPTFLYRPTPIWRPTKCGTATPTIQREEESRGRQLKQGFPVVCDALSRVNTWTLSLTKPFWFIACTEAQGWRRSGSYTYAYSRVSSSDAPSHSRESGFTRNEADSRSEEDSRTVVQQ